MEKEKKNEKSKEKKEKKEAKEIKKGQANSLILDFIGERVKIYTENKLKFSGKLLSVRTDGLILNDKYEGKTFIPIGKISAISCEGAPNEKQKK